MRELAAVVGLVAGVAMAQPGLDPVLITGKTFQGLRLPVGVTSGTIEFAAAKAICWNEPGGASADGAAYPGAMRMLLSGDVTAKVAGYELTATRAAVWLSRLEGETWQVWIYLERGGSAVQGPGIKVSGDRLPVQGIVNATGGIRLKVDRRLEGRPNDPFVGEAERALAQRLRAMVQAQAPQGVRPEDLVRRGEPVPRIEGDLPPEPSADDLKRIAEMERKLSPAEASQPIFAADGVFSIVPSGTVTFTGEKDQQRSLTTEGGIVVTYWDRRRDSTMQLTAERAVVFFEPGSAPDLLRTPTDRVRGLYLEGDVVADIQGPEGHYTMRSPRVYYAVKENRAVLLDAVFWTYDQQRALPLYVRAKSIEQLSADEFKATSARLTNTPFFSPDLSIGASTVTIAPTMNEDGQRRVNIDARDVTLRAGGVPFFWYPRMKGDPQDIPIKDLRLENSSGSGTALKTTWNFYSLVGLQTPKDSRADLLLDWYFDRGPAVGTELGWKNDTGSGGLFGYLVPNDYGRDLLVTGAKKDFGGETRGMITGEHRAALSDEWTLFLEGAYISDETFIDGYFEDQAKNRREFTNSIYLRRLKDNSALTVLGKTTFNNFIANEYLLQAPGYTVDKEPEIGYTRLADDLLADHPGLLTYSSEYRLSQMRLRFPSVAPNEIGFLDAARANSIFGVAPGQSIADGLRAQGYTQEPVTRFDTRHEVDMPLSAGPLNITPFVAARFTGYNDDFEQFSPRADEAYRAWGSEGVTVATEVQHVDNSVESRLFDLHRMRHIIEPSLTVWHADTTVDRVDLPVYDDEVEAISEGTAVKMAVDQTFQTQRGGPGRWRSVDVLKINTELVVSSGDVDRKSPVGRFFDFRPEESTLGGTYGTVDAVWQVSEVLAVGGDIVYDFDLSQPARTDAGITLQSTPEFTAYVDLRYLNAQDSTTTTLGAAYELTKKYSIASALTYDTNLGQIQSVSGEVRRRYPNVVVGVGLSYNNITSETSLGLVFQPVGLSNKGGARLKGLGTGSSGFGG